MEIERGLGKTLIVNLVLLAYWFPALIADTVHIFTDYATNWCHVLILLDLIAVIAITAMDMEYNGVTEMLILLRDRVTHVAIVVAAIPVAAIVVAATVVAAILVSILITLDFVVLQIGIYRVSKWTLQAIHEHLMNSIVMLISVFSLNSHFRRRDFWLGK